MTGYARIVRGDAGGMTRGPLLVKGSVVIPPTPLEAATWHANAQTITQRWPL